MNSAVSDAVVPGGGRVGAVDNGGWLGLVGLLAWTELRSSARSAERVVGVVAIPVLLYAMFGLPSASDELPAGTSIGLAMLVSLSSYGVISLAIFTFGEDVATERGRGWIRTMRATPLPVGAHLLGKGAAALAHGLLIVVAMAVLAATAGGVRLPASTWLAFVAAMLGGVVAFSSLGFAIAYLARPKVATAIANLIFLPLSFASGFFFPLSELPDVVGAVARWLPTFHFGQLAYRVVMPVDEVAAFTGAASAPAWSHLGIVVASAIVFGLLALAGARREAVTRRG